MTHQILIVEDDEPIRQTLKYLLEGEGYQVAEAANGAEALNYLKNTPTKPHLILLDLMMPIMTGVEFLEIKRHCNMIAAIPVVIISAAAEGVRSQIKDNGIPFVKKPIDLDSLMKWVTQFCKPTG